MKGLNSKKMNYVEKLRGSSARFQIAVRYRSNLRICGYCFSVPHVAGWMDLEVEPFRKAVYCAHIGQQPVELTNLVKW